MNQNGNKRMNLPNYDNLIIDRDAKPKYIEIGARFNSWIILDYLGYQVYFYNYEDKKICQRAHRVICQCDCGNIRVVAYRHARYNNSLNCGCVASNKLIKLKPIERSINVVFKRYSDGDLIKEEFVELSQKDCYYCGCKPFNNINVFRFPSNKKKTDNSKRQTKHVKNGLKEGTFIYNGLDRIDSSKPHDKDNVVTSCKHCNRWKSDLEKDSFLDHVKKIYLHINKENPEKLLEDYHYLQLHNGDYQ